MDDLVCFIGQKAFIEKDGKLLVLHNPSMGLDFPGGKVKERESDLSKALQREVREETGLEIIVGKPFYTWFFTIPKDSGHRSAGKKIFNVGYRCTHVSGDVVLSSEHDRFQWIGANDIGQSEGSDFYEALKEYILKN